MTTAANWFVTSPRTGDAMALASGPARAVGRTVTVARVSGGNASALLPARSLTQNCPPAVPSSVVSGSVQIETRYGPALRSDTIGNGGPSCACSAALERITAVTQARTDARGVIQRRRGHAYPSVD